MKLGQLGPEASMLTIVHCFTPQNFVVVLLTFCLNLLICRGMNVEHCKVIVQKDVTYNVSGVIYYRVTFTTNATIWINS